jgi:hypothetical protein
MMNLFLSSFFKFYKFMKMDFFKLISRRTNVEAARFITSIMKWSFKEPLF